MNIVSVIIPIYKVEKYLRQCLDSVINQTYTDLEIILVDDGSPDNCGEICDVYAEIDYRIKVIHKQNEGLGYARNTGLSIATGEYVYFVDSDDWIDVNFIERMMDISNKYDADMTICGYKKYTEDACEMICSVSDICVYENNKVHDEILLPMIGRESTHYEDWTINMCVWTNLYRRNIIEDNSIRFMSEREYLSEDICFNLDYLYYSKKVVMTSDCLYHYRSNPVSLTNCYKANEFSMIIRLHKKINEMIDSMGLRDKVEFRLHRFFITKTRKTLFLLENSRMPLKDRLQITKNILNDKTLQRILSEYPIKKYALKYKVPAYFMKMGFSFGTVILFRFQTVIKSLLVR